MTAPILASGHVVESTTNLTPWTTSTNVTIVTNHIVEDSFDGIVTSPGLILEVTDHGSMDEEHRFYRIREQ